MSFALHHSRGYRILPLPPSRRPIVVLILCTQETRHTLLLAMVPLLGVHFLPSLKGEKPHYTMYRVP